MAQDTHKTERWWELPLPQHVHLQSISSLQQDHVTVHFSVQANEGCGLTPPLARHNPVRQETAAKFWRWQRAPSGCRASGRSRLGRWRGCPLGHHLWALLQLGGRCASEAACMDTGQLRGAVHVACASMGTFHSGTETNPGGSPWTMPVLHFENAGR